MRHIKRHTAHLTFALALTTLLAACGDNNEPGDPPPASTAKLVITIENISNDDTFRSTTDAPIKLALAPGLFTLTTTPDDMFKSGATASPGLERLAETGNPADLRAELDAQPNTYVTGIIGDIDNLDYVATPVLPGASLTFTIPADGDRTLALATMLGQSNDTFLGTPAGGITQADLRAAADGDQDITARFQWWDAGTEVNEPLGEGMFQPGSDDAIDAGTAEGGTIQPQRCTDDDGARTCPDASAVVRVTVKRLKQ